MRWLQTMKALLDKMDQRASTMANVVTTISSACTDASVEQLKQAVKNGIKQQEAMSHAILLQQVELGMTDDGSHHSSPAAGVDESDGHGHNDAHNPSQSSTTTRKIQKISLSIMKILSGSIDAIEIALSYETMQLETWLHDITEVATHASKLRVEVAQIQEEAKDMADQANQQLASLQKRHAQRSWLWIISTAEHLLLGEPSSVDLYDLDSHQTIFLDIGGGGDYQQQWYQTPLVNIDRWEELLLAVAGDSHTLMLSLCA